MKTKNTRMALVLALALLGSKTQLALADEPLRVVTTLSTFADIAEEIGGAHIAVSSIAAPTFNAHFIEPRPTDILRVKKADLFIHGGLDFEAWRGPLLNAAGNVDVRPGGKRELDVSRSVTLLNAPSGPLSRAQGDIHLYGNPHYWTDPENGLLIARSITAKLCQIDPAHAADYKHNLQLLEGKLNQKIQSWRELFATLKGAELIGYHDEWVYLMKFAGLSMKEFLEPKPGIPPTPKHLEFLTTLIKDRHIAAIVQATFYPTDAGEELAERTGTKLLLLCQNVGETEACNNYINTVDHNLQTIAGALKK